MEETNSDLDSKLLLPKVIEPIKLGPSIEAILSTTKQGTDASAGSSQRLTSSELLLLGGAGIGSESIIKERNEIIGQDRSDNNGHGNGDDDSECDDDDEAFFNNQYTGGSTKSTRSEHDFLNETNLEKFISNDNPVLEFESEGNITEVVRFKFIASADDITGKGTVYVNINNPDIISLESLHKEILQNSNRFEDIGKKKEEKEEVGKPQECLQNKTSATTATATEATLFTKLLELNTYPLDVRYKAMDRTILDNIEHRLKVKIDTEGICLNNSMLFINFTGPVEAHVIAARNEVRFLILSWVDDQAKETELRDLVKMVLSVGERSSINIRRHTVLIGLYPVQAIILSDEMILVESREHSLTDNEVLRKTASQIMLALQKLRFNVVEQSSRESRLLSAPPATSTSRMKSKSGLKPFDQACYHSIFVTICGLQQNATDAFRHRSNRICRIYNSKTYVSLDDQKTMQTLKVQGDEIVETVSSHVRALEALIDDDIKMAFMNLCTMRVSTFLYRMTVNDKMTLSQTDKRVARAAHDIELILYSYLLRYSELESAIKIQQNNIANTVEGQELEGINVQTKVLVANTMITVLSTAIGFCGYVTGAFGMNVDNTYIKWPNGSFAFLCAFTFIFIFVSTKIGMLLLRRSGVLPNTMVFTLEDYSEKELK